MGFYDRSRVVVPAWILAPAGAFLGLFGTILILLGYEWGWLVLVFAAALLYDAFDARNRAKHIRAKHNRAKSHRAKSPNKEPEEKP